jgi:flagellum-specific ATP synthase
MQALPAYLERAGPGEGGSITALVSVLVDGDDRSDPVADIARGSLDGHLVLDRRIAEAGRYPALDVLASLSRLAGTVWTDEQCQLVQRLRAMIAAYEDTRDLRAIDRSAGESDPELAQAVALVPRIYDALRQSPDDPPSADAYAELAATLRQGGATAG